ncbi:MAG TPA: GNAT family N-acetyltransferase [Ktedonobacteraceae bacterium]|nr:GNAT family N-acetyltransferase [Ktedonobacteraceae bacterium]
MIRYEKYIHLPRVVVELLPYSEQAEAARRWQELERLTNNTGLTNSWTWIKTWLEHHAGIVQATFAFGQRGKQTIGAALIVQANYKRKGLSIDRVHLGTGKYVEYNRLLVVPQYLDSFAMELVRTVQNKFRWSELHLDGFVPEHGDALLLAGRSAGLSFEVDVKASPAFDFRKATDDGYEDVISALGKNTRYQIRRSLRLFEQQFGQIALEWAETPEQAKDILKELIELHQKRWTQMNQSGAFDKPHLRSYYVGLIDALKLWPQGSAIVCRVKAGETTLGCIFNYVENGHIMFTKGGMAQFEDNKLKPGFVTHLICMEECRKRSLSEEQNGRQGLWNYDFLAGDEPYKDNISNTAGNLIWATAERGVPLWLMGKARAVKNLIKR